MRDLTYALRFLRKRWTFTTVAVVVMALGISLTATMFAIIEGVVLGGPDYRDLDRIVYLETTLPQSQFFQSVRVHDYMDWDEQQTVFDDMAAYYGTSVILSGDGNRAEGFRGSRVSSSTFSLLGVAPYMGRVFTPDEDYVENPNVVLLGYHIWANRYDRDPDIIGKTLRLNARPMTVIGVMPDGFRFPEDHDMWLPLSVDPNAIARGEGQGLQVIARMSPGITEDEVRTQLGGIAARLEQQYPEANRDIVPVVRIWKDVQFVDAEVNGILYTMFVAVIGVLLIACANVANLLFALTMARGKELAIRTAMGAERWRVVRQLLLESLILASGGAALGIGITYLSLRLFARAIVPLGPPVWVTFEMGTSVLLFVIAITAVSALAAGLLPALYATRSDVSGVLQDQSRGSSSRSVNRWSTGLVGLEVALSCALLVGAGLMVRTTFAIGSEDYGVTTEGVLTASLRLPAESYPDSLARFQAVDRIRREVAGIPGVTHAAISSNVPGLGNGNIWYGIRDREYANDSEYSFAGRTIVTPEFFDTYDAQFLSGRRFDSRDAAGAEPVVIVDGRFAERNWPNEDPIGKQLRWGRSDSQRPWMTVVGVVRKVKMAAASSFGGRPPEGLFIPAAQSSMGGFVVSLRTAGDPLGLAPQLREVIANIDSDIPVARSDTMDNRLRLVNMEFLIIGWMFSIFGVVALLLASVGLYAVMAFSVSRRQTEVGVRMAMGAEPGRIIQLILLQGSKPLGAGIVVGLGLAVLLGMALSSQLYGVTATDPLTFSAVPLLLALVSLAALLIPASRASRITPVVALREE
jgi:putative ABC transport system permease protein